MKQKKLEVLWNDVFRYVREMEEEIKRLRKENEDLKKEIEKVNEIKPKRGRK